MTSYIIRRLLSMIPALLGITLITFTLMHLTPGGPFETDHPDAQVQAALMHAYHLDEPIWPTFLGPGAETWRLLVLVLGIGLLATGIAAGVWRFRFYSTVRPFSTGAGLLLIIAYILMATEKPGTSGETGFVGGQFLRYLGNLIRGDLGYSFSYPGQTVNEIIARTASNSFVVGGTAFLILVAIAMPLGVLAALRQNSWVDYLASGISLVGYSVPNFVMGTFLILATGLWLKIIPIAAWEQFPRDLILPAFVLAIRPMAVLARLTRASMIDVLNQDYIRTAWAKGLAARVVVARHGLRNALLPVVTVMGDHLGDLITGSIVVEALFAVPGIGAQFVNSIFAHDYGIMMGTTIFYATLVLTINLIVDLLYAVIDPRIKLGAGARS
jgi:oligopeptide transport system permease protein